MNCRYTREDILKDGHVTEHELFFLESTNLYLEEGQYIVYKWENAPKNIRKVCCFNGGDEDWVIITKKEPEFFPLWIERTDSCSEPDVYLFNNCVVYVGSHG